MLRFLLLSVSLLFCLHSTTATFAADPWNQFGGPSGNFSHPKISTTAKAGEWKRTIGTGESGVVSDGSKLFTMYSTPTEDRARVKEHVVAMNLNTGESIWDESYPIEKHAVQQSFGGSPIQPHATPFVVDGRVFTLGYTGILQTRDTANGKLLWSSDLVADHGATPVQFGFSASPIVHDGKLILAVGGKSSAIAFELGSGKVLWKSESAEPAYATPTVMKLGNRVFVVIVTRDTLLGLDPTDGKTVWKYTLPKKGLTNVPTPLVLKDGKILVSGQGFEGTRLLQLSQDGLTVSEVWHQRKTQYFYTVWASDDKFAYGFSGNSGQRMTALRVSDGSILWQELGQTDSNLQIIGEEILALRGDGSMTLGKSTETGFEVRLGGVPLAGRCWTPPTILNDGIIIRTTKEIARVNWSVLKADFKAPPDRGVSALQAAYGGGKEEK